MASLRVPSFCLLACVTGLVLPACGSDSAEPPGSLTSTTGSGAGGAGGGAGGAGGAGGGPLVPGPAFDRFCKGAAWDGALEPGKAMPLGGDYVGVYKDMPLGTMETMRVYPDHPFHVKTIRAAFGSDGTGTGRIRLMTTFGRSYPSAYPGDKDPTDDVDLMPPIDINLDAAPDPEVPLEIDVSGQGIFLEPGQHYAIVYEHTADTGPYLAVETVKAGELSRALLLVPGEFFPFGVGSADEAGNYRLELDGDFFCAWTDAERWFGEDLSQPFAQTPGYFGGFTDLDGDGHDDFFMSGAGPKAYFGDGAGHFTAAGWDVFAEAGNANLIVFGDVDNDGDEDAFAAPYVSHDADGDGWTILEGDCNDSPADEDADGVADGAVIKPGGAVDAPNGLDDDCDGVADDGTDASDADADGVSIAAGDCDDTHADTFPGAPELADSRDNDCDGVVDDAFFDRILLNDGTGHLTMVASSGVEALDPSPVGAMGDGNADGFLDVYWGNWLVHYPDPAAVASRYFEGNGDGTFVDAQVAAGAVVSPPRPTYGVTWTDFDNDGAQDIYASNYRETANVLWHNEGDGTFEDVATALGAGVEQNAPLPGGHSYGTDFGDFDNDGDMDAFVPNLSHPREMPKSDPSVFLVNQGASAAVPFSFVNQRADLGFIYDEGDFAAAFADYDNDMDLDLLVTALYPNHFSKLYRNDGDHFVDVTYEAKLFVNDARAAAWSDIDEDGDLDLFIAGVYGPTTAHLFVNRVGQDNHWVELSLEGAAGAGGKSNRDAIGARVTLTAGGVTQMREVKAGGGHDMQHSRIVHFGLAQETAITKVEVRWVGGSTETITGLAPNGRFEIVEGSGQALPLP